MSNKIETVQDFQTVLKKELTTLINDKSVLIDSVGFVEGTAGDFSRLSISYKEVDVTVTDETPDSFDEAMDVVE